MLAIDGTITVLVPLVYTIRLNVLVDGSPVVNGEVRTELKRTGTRLGADSFISSERKLSSLSEHYHDQRRMTSMMGR